MRPRRSTTATCASTTTRLVRRARARSAGDLQALTDPAYRDLLVVENPATSSPGLAFLMASVAEFGEDGWADYWTAAARQRRRGRRRVGAGVLRALHRGGRGERPLVVSYGTSPPGEVVFADPPVDEPPTAVVESTCFRQVEFAGVLRGTDAPDEAEQLVDFLISPASRRRCRSTCSCTRPTATCRCPRCSPSSPSCRASPLTLDPATIDANREAWIDEWTDLVLR